LVGLLPAGKAGLVVNTALVTGKALAASGDTLVVVETATTGVMVLVKVAASEAPLAVIRVVDCVAALTVDKAATGSH
jgi:hypothetical protein